MGMWVSSFVKRVIIPLPCIAPDRYYVRQFVIVVLDVPLIIVMAPVVIDPFANNCFKENLAGISPNCINVMILWYSL